MDQVAHVRAFNRFYTRWVGALDEGFLETDRSLPEARVLFELGRAATTEVANLRATLEMDAGYLSRLLKGLERDGLVTRERSAADARRQVVRLTKAGRSEFALLDRRSAERVGASLEALAPGERERVTAAMAAIESALGHRGDGPGVTLRAPAPGDLGWIVERHGAIYADEYGWDERFEGLVARIVGDFATSRDPDREAAWVAELAGARVGSVLCVRKDDATAQLRLLLVEPWARGRGIGARLVDECLAFARAAGYRAITLWTNDVLRDARRVYERAGFELVDEEPHAEFGSEVVGQNWSLALPS
ncbi:MAG TPA: bifunctional helix-turn-helix transcriptional regulator/GNAT family N-acetyltransferase [Thermoleophilaceae bacterium]|nr:bifunctional helix-turn-helix transcriptional regulator/GNAT family N-acetyltransferase [Thermoleophilaceae bacterium]